MKAENSDYVESQGPSWHSIAIVASLALLALALSGCGARGEEESRAAANVWHAAEAIRLGADPAKPVAAIQAAAEAIAESNGHVIDKGAGDE